MGGKLDRREFIRNTTLGIAALSIGSRARADAINAPPILVQGKGLEIEKNCDRYLTQLLAPLGGIGAFVKRGQTVLIKPNLGFPNAPEVRATTSPTLVASLVRLVAGCAPKKILVADYPCRDCELVSGKNGYAEALKGLEAELLIANKEKLFTEVAVPKGRELKKTKVLKALLESEVHIAFPLAKSHAGATFTGVLKGMMGVIWDRDILHKPMELHQPIADLNTRLRPHLCIMEGIQVMADSGPVGPGTLINTDCLIAGTDPVAVDAAGVELAPLFGKKVMPAQVKHLMLAEQMKIGKLSLPSEQVRKIEFAAS